MVASAEGRCSDANPRTLEDGDHDTHNMDEVAIIGAGVAGLTLALFLHQNSIPSHIYESRPAGSFQTLGGAMMLPPNTLALLATLSAYTPLLKYSYPFSHVHYKNESQETTDAYPMGSPEGHGYSCLRIYRRDLHAVLVSLCQERHIPITYGSKFTSIVEETLTSVTFTVAKNGEEVAGVQTIKTPLLVATDGIHSTVRSYITPVTPIFVKMMAIAFAAPTASLRIPEDKGYGFPVTISGRGGGFVLAPQGKEGEEMMGGTQFPVAEMGKEGWEELGRDKAKLKAMLWEKMERGKEQKEEDAWPDIVRSTLENINEESMYIWPFYMLPKLDTWVSKCSERDGASDAAAGKDTAKGRVVLIGDAAHAIPPTTGQGAGMAVEDAATLAKIIGACRRTETDGKSAEKPTREWNKAISWWQDTRMKRLGELVALTKKLNNRRLPAEKQALLPREEIWVDEGDSRQMDWLYVPEVLREVEGWIAGEEGR